MLQLPRHRYNIPILIFYVVFLFSSYTNRPIDIGHFPVYKWYIYWYDTCQVTPAKDPRVATAVASPFHLSEIHQKRGIRREERSKSLFVCFVPHIDSNKSSKSSKSKTVSALAVYTRRRSSSGFSACQVLDCQIVGLRIVTRVHSVPRTRYLFFYGLLAQTRVCMYLAPLPIFPSFIHLHYPFHPFILPSTIHQQSSIHPPATEYSHIHIFRY
jgi:hypothetical protein